MPIYEYRCDACESTFEVMARITAAPPDSCEKCGDGPVHKLISQSSFLLKGSGWASDGYSSAKGGGSSKSSTSSTKSESKPSTSKTPSSD